MSDSRARSASPAREPKPKKQKTSGFKWKEKRPHDNEPQGRDAGHLERGYRDRSPRRESYNPRQQDTERDERGATGRGGRESELDRQLLPRDSGQGVAKGNATTTEKRDPFATTTPKDPAKSTKPKSDKPKKPPRPTAPSEPMIIVNVNDRLGTKAAIPCLASDNIKAFKAVVAAHIGRQPHEIMIKRQGERPFKDQLTLEDYGVSSGVQLDLEIDTGD